MKKLLFVIFLLIFYSQVRGSEWYLKPNLRYHTPLTYQSMPGYFSAQVFVPVYTLATPWTVVDINRKFSLAHGLSYGMSVGCFFNDLLGIEMMYDRFGISETYQSDYPDIEEPYIVGKSDWKFTSNKLITSVVFRRSYGLKHEFLARAGVLIGINSIYKKIYGRGVSNAYDVNGGIGYGYNLGFEYRYELLDRIAVFAELGIENQFYSPTSASLSQASYQLAMVDIIEYQKEYYRYNDPVYYDVYYQLKEHVKLNSLYVGFGLVFKLSEL
ncbi:hypothetical protein [Saccharicrinis sp. FJH54]|uniref:hypothetical protein n=1 Tax=Saccharicrinis sp. FJH54 TaxID=3344665 RepID=UPI0035D4D379